MEFFKIKFIKRVTQECKIKLSSKILKDRVEHFLKRTGKKKQTVFYYCCRVSIQAHYKLFGIILSLDIRRKSKQR